VYSFGKITAGRLGHSNNYSTKIIENVQQIAIGPRHGLASTSSNKLYSWGFNMYGQTDPSTQTDILSPQMVQSISPSD